MSEAIAITSGKGGTGKSTVCAGLGIALSKNGHSVVILELDTGMRCLDIFFGLHNEVKFDFSDYALGKCKLQECIIKVNNTSGLNLICSPIHKYNETGYEKITETISKLKEIYDYVLIDTGAGLSKELLKASHVIDKAFFVVTPDVISIRDASGISDEFYKFGCRHHRLIINKVHRKYIDSGLVNDLDSVIDDSGIQLIGVIPDDSALFLFYGKGKKIPQSSPSAIAFSAVAKRICGETIPLTIK